ncbi:HAD-IA family hydrolase [Actinacidiphila glaucinigra]|uniref:Putative hydrolase of the HAD superfamily n=1 Tax=Actinacidiphila glaucinigra TaxID=235986 RepID=A0A239LVY3_9ACTN|nr:HAD-IA family hydrolase [Actinacidiphila glaucinigra]SNT34028.1 putative hydrolase of the HAD superfamily [Actinacidiphila glaucinigra]
MTLRPPGSAFEAFVFDYNGVIGVQPPPEAWERLAQLAGWPADRTPQFMQAFWARRSGYDAGVITSAQFWSSGLVLRTDRTFGDLLPELIATDTAMWTEVDPAVIHLLRAAHRAGARLTLLSNAPHTVADAIDVAEWSCSLMSRTIYSARIGLNKPHRGAYEAALAAAGWPDPASTLFIDDRSENCAAAAQLGIQTLHYTGKLGELAQHLPQLHPAPAVRETGTAASVAA